MSNKLRYDGRVFIVTGAAGELGGIYARLLASRGAIVVANDLCPSVQEFAESVTRDGGKCIAVIGSVTSQEDVDRIIDVAMTKYGRIDGLINNAGVAYERTLAATSMEDIRKTMDLHYFAPVMMIKAVWPHMKSAKYGRIVNITSSTLFGLAGWANYSAAKAAVCTLARSTALEGKPFGISVNAMAPAATTKAMLRNVTDPKIQEQAKNARPEQCGPLAAYLLHESCEFSGRTFFNGSGHVADILFAQSQGATDENITLEKVEAFMKADEMHANPTVWHDTIAQNNSQNAK